MATMTSPQPHDRRHLRVWVGDGPVDDPYGPAISPVDHGLVAGDGVFEALKVTEAGPFGLRRHLDRLTRSARALGLPDPDHGLVREAVAAVTEGRQYGLGKIRITWTGGPGPLGSQGAYGPGLLVVAADEMTPAPEVGRLVTAPWLRNTAGAMTGVKTTSYGENVRGLAHAHAHGATEAMFVNTEGNLSEGTGSNVFCVLDGQVVTPPLSAGILDGITRRLVMEWCEVTERDLTLAEAQSAQEVFVTSSLRDVQAVDEWDEARFTAVGPVTAQVRRVFAERSAADPEP